MTIAPPDRPAAPRPAGVPASRPQARPQKQRVINPADLIWRWLAGTHKRAPGPDDPSSAVALATTSLMIAAALILGFLAQVTLLGTLKHNRDQQVAYDDLRLSLAEGTTPVGPVEGKPIPLGAPIAQLTIPVMDLKEVVLEGTSAGALRSGVGHRRDTVLPGQAGTSILMGRRLAYGGPFGGLADLNEGDPISVLTGQGRSEYQVVAVRRAGELQPPPVAAGGSRITMITSAGSRFAPEGVLRVDADLVGTAFPAAAPVVTAATLPRAEALMATEPGALEGTVGWGFLLAVGAIAVTWLRLRWGRWQAWLVGVPVLGYLGTATSDQAMRLLPNLL